jgi:histone acetyltransferase (RNA polymerase elongator complex component)
MIPPYTRIKRLIRDIPAPEIVAGSSITNLSQLAHETMLREYQEALSSSHHYEGEPSRACGKPSKEKIIAFYHRLYENNELISTEIIGEKPDMNSYRHFVSLDTRSREVRNKK